MKKIIYMSFYFILLLSTNMAAAYEEQTAEKPLVDINVGIELYQLENSAKDIAQSIERASQALQEMAKNPNMQPEQQQKMVETFTNLDHLAKSFETTIVQIPDVIQQATPPISNAINSTLSNIQLTVILVLVAIVLLLVCVLIAIYYGILKPSSQVLISTTKRLDSMAASLQLTASIVEKSTEQQLLILKTINPTEEAES